MIHHQLTQRKILPIPNLWMVAVAALLGKSVLLWFNRQHNQQQWSRKRQKRYIAGLASLTVCYGLLSLQLYISSTLVWPWLLPMAVFWTYILPALRRSTDA